MFAKRLRLPQQRAPRQAWRLQLGERPYAGIRRTEAARNVFPGLAGADGRNCGVEDPTVWQDAKGRGGPRSGTREGRARDLWTCGRQRVNFSVLSAQCRPTLTTSSQSSHRVRSPPGSSPLTCNISEGLFLFYSLAPEESDPNLIL